MKNRIRIGDKVMGIMGVAGGYAGTVTAIKSDGRNTVVFFVDDDGATYETLDFNVTKNVPAKGVFPRKNPVSSRKTESIRVGNKVMGIMGIEGGYAGTVTAIKRDGRHTVIFFVDDDGVMHETLDFNVTKNVPAKGVFPRKNPVKPRKGESERKFVSRCMSEEKKSFPKQKQRIAVCLSKARKNPFNDRNLDA